MFGTAARRGWSGVPAAGGLRAPARRDVQLRRRGVADGVRDAAPSARQRARGERGTEKKKGGP